MLDRLSLGPGDSAAQSPSDSQKRRVSALQLHSTETGVSLCLQVKGRGSAEVVSALQRRLVGHGGVEKRGQSKTAARASPHPSHRSCSSERRFLTVNRV